MISSSRRWLTTPTSGGFCCMCSGGSLLRCRHRMAACSPGIVGVRRARRSLRCWRTYSCITRSMPGWPGNFPRSGSSGTAMMWWFTVAARLKRRNCVRRSPSGWRGAGDCSCIRKRPASSTARTGPGVAAMSTRRSRSWGMGFAHGWSRRGRGSISSASTRPSATTRQTHPGADPLLATAPAQWIDPQGTRARYQRRDAWVDQLLWAVLPLKVAHQPQPHQRLLDAVDRAEVQAVPETTDAGMGSLAESRT